MKLFLSLSLLGLLTACGGSTPGDNGGGSAELGIGDEAPRVAPASLAKLAKPEIVLANPHIGHRRFEVHRPDGSFLKYREEVAVDGQGAFSVEPLEPLSAVRPSWDTFSMLQGRRAGFVFLYRDFAIRDEGLFQENWTLEELGLNQKVAGRLCSKFRVQRQDDKGSTYEVLIDAQGLVLAYRELDGDGNLISRLVYETFDTTATQQAFDAIAWHTPTREQELLDWTQPLEPQIPGVDDTRILQPRLLPAGYRLREAAILTDSQDRCWLKLTYLDGVEPLFFMVDLPASGTQGHAGPGGSLPDPVGPSTADRVIVAEIGRATAVQGRLRGRDVMAVGKVSEDELLDLLESSLP